MAEETNKEVNESEKNSDTCEKNPNKTSGLRAALELYENEMLKDFLDPPKDKRPLPLSAEGQDKMLETLTDMVGKAQAEVILKKEAQISRKKLRGWKRQKRVAAFYKKRAVWGAAAAVFALCLLVGGTVITVQAFKLPSINFFQVAHDDFTNILVDEDDVAAAVSNAGMEKHDTIETVYTLGKVIDGYELVRESVTENAVRYVYRNEEQKEYVFTQLPWRNQDSVNTEQEEGHFIDSLYGQAYYAEYNDNGVLKWRYQGYSFTVGGPLQKDEMLSLQESLMKENTYEKEND